MPDPNITLSNAAKAYAEAKAREKGLDGPDQFVESLVERAIRREAKMKRLEELLMEGINSGPPEPFDWDEMRREAKARLAARASKA